MHTGFWWGNMKKRNQWEDLGVDGRIILRYLKEIIWMVCNGLIRFRIETSDGVL
jgi:hypothetical protein